MRQIFTLVGVILGICLIGGTLLADLIMPIATTFGTGTSTVAVMFEESPDNLGFVQPSEQSVLLTPDGGQITTFYTESRIVVASNKISKRTKNAVVLIEDRHFYEHHGIDVQGLTEAFVNSLTGGNIAGSSSITQQYVKNALIEQGRVNNDHSLIEQATGRTITRKINGTRLAIAVERKMSEDGIFAGYLNLAQFGPNRYGVEVSVQHFFSKSAKDLDIPGLTILAGITQSPARWNSVKHPEEAKTRWDTVIHEVYCNGYVTKGEVTSSQSVPIADMLHISEKPTECTAVGNATYFCEYARDDLLDNESWGKNRNDRVAKLYHGGLAVQTTLGPKKQREARDAFVNSIPTDDASDIQTAMSSTESGAGRVVAIAQNTNYGSATETDPRATEVDLNVSRSMGGGSGLQSGLAFKVFILIEWLRSGRSQYDIINSNGGTLPRNSWNIPCTPRARSNYRFGNLEAVGDDMVSVLESTRQSVSGSFVRMANKLNLCDVTDTAKNMGAERGDGGKWEYFPSMVLGANEVTPLSVTTAILTLGAEGLHYKPQSFTKVSDSDGNVLAPKDPDCDQVLDKEIARKTTSVLRQVVVPRATDERAQAPGREIAGKTGAADDDTNAQFMGCAPQLASAVWQGHMSGTKTMLNTAIRGKRYGEVYGGLFPATVFSTYIKAALEDQPNKHLNDDKQFNQPSSSPSNRSPSPSPSFASPSESSDSSGMIQTPSEDQSRHKNDDEDDDSGGGESDDEND